jgi:site-specific DNA recombinase
MHFALRPSGHRMRRVGSRTRRIDETTRDALLKAIARSRGWVDAILSGHTASIEEIATAEGLAERHVRFLMPLAFASPRIVAAIAEGDVPRDLTVSDSRER